MVGTLRLGISIRKNRRFLVLVHVAEVLSWDDFGESFLPVLYLNYAPSPQDEFPEKDNFLSAIYLSKWGSFSFSYF